MKKYFIKINNEAASVETKASRRSKKILNFFVSSILLVSLFFSPFLPLVGVAEAAINKQINYQGKLTNSANVAVPNTTYSIIFSLYTVPTGGTAIWSETRSVTTANGLFSEMLGDGASPLTSVNFNQTLYLGVKVGADAEMTPRKKLGAVPAAVEAEHAASSDSATKATNLAGGNSGTLKGSIPYQSNTDTTSLLSPNTTTTKKFLRMTGDGINGATPAWDTLVDADIPSALTGKTYNGMTLSALATGFSIAGGTVSKTLTVTDTASISGTNTGDETQATIKTKLGAASAGVDGYLTGTDWSTFNNKQATLISGTNIKTINSNSLLGAGDISVATLIGFTPENIANKVTSLSGTSTDVQYPSAKLTYDQLALKQPLATNLTSLSGLTYVSPSFVKMTAAGTFALDTNTYLTSSTGVTSVSGTLNRITSTGGTTPVIDISSTFEALLGKVANPLSQFAATTSLQLAGVISNETGSGSLVFATSPTLVTPALGTPSALVGTNISGTAANLTAGAVTNATLTTPLTNNGGAGTLTWPVAGATLTIPSGGGTLGSNAFTSTAYLPTASFTDAAVTGKLITGYISGAGTVAATDTILQAIQKLNGNILANGSGTVTSVDTAAANNGVTATWTNTTTTPRLTIGLGAITPTSVNGLTITPNGTNTLNIAAGQTLTVTTGGTLGSAAYTSSTAYQPTSTNLTSLSGLTYVSPSFVKMTAAGTFALDTNTYLTGNQTITLTGDVTGSGTTSIATTIAANSVALTTDTTGNYVAGLTAGTAITISGTAGEGWSPTVAVTADSIGDTQLAFNTGQNLTTASSPTFAGLTSTASSTLRGLLVDNATATYDRIGITASAVGTARFDGTITNADLTAARTYTLPDATGTIALTSDIPAQVYPGAGIAVSTGSAWGTSITDNSTNWNTAYSNRIATFTTTGSSGSATFTSNTLNIPTYTLAGLGGQPLATNLTSLSGLTYVSPSFVKMTAAGTFALDTNTYLTSSTGVSSIAGTANQITASAATGAVTLSIPSDFRAPGTLNAVTSIATGAGAGTVRISSTGVGSFITGTTIGSQTFTTNNIADSGALTIASATTNALTLNAGTSGILNLNNTSTGDINLGGGSGSTGCTITNSTGALTCASTMTVLNGDMNITKSGSYANFTNTTYSNVAWEGARIGFNRARGTISVPTAVVSGDTVGWFDYFANDGTASQRVAQFSVTVDGAVSSGIVPGKFSILTANSVGATVARLTAYSNDNITMATNGGNVGIGPVTPTTSLYVSKAAANAILSLDNTGNGNTSGIDFIRERLSGPNINGGSIFMDSDTSSSTNSLLYIQSQSTGANAGVTSALTAANGVRLLLRGGTGIFSIENGATESMRILANGYLGIGTTNPSALLSVGSTSQFQVSTAGAVTAVGLNGGSGLIQGTGGLTITGTVSLPINSITDAMASDTLTASIFKGSGTTTDAVDLGTAEIAGTLTADHGGTGIASYAIGDLLYASGATALSKLADVAAGRPLLSGGLTTAPGYAGYTFAGTAAQTYSFPTTTATLARTDAAQTFTGIQTFNALPAFNGGTTGSTAPFTVDSTFKVTNLNADLLDDHDSSYFATASNISGTQNYVSKFNAAGTGVVNSQIFDNGTNVGIGTTAPGSKLNIISDSLSFLSTSNYAVGIQTYKDIGTGNGSQGGLYVQAGFNKNADIARFSSIGVGYADVPVMVIKDSGYVGIGTTNPGAPLEVNGTEKISGALSHLYFSDSTASGLGIIMNNPGNHYVGMQAFGTTGNPSRMSLGWGTTSGATITEVLSVLDTGYVGIGTTAPGQLLHLYSTGNAVEQIDGAAGSSTGILFAQAGTEVGRISFAANTDMRFATGANLNRMTITSGGNVGIGTINPLTRLQVNESALVSLPTLGTATGGFAITEPGGLYGLWAGVSGSGNTWLQSQRSDSNVSTYSMLLQPSGGNLGVGIASPSSNFQVSQVTTGSGTVATAGTTTLTGTGTQFTNTFKVGDTITVSGETIRTIASITSNTVLDVTVAFSTTASSLSYTLTGGDRFAVKGNGNVGIGTTGPGYKLDVSGDIQATTNYRSSSNNIVLTDSSGTVFRGVRANAWADALSTRFFQVGTSGDNMAFTTQNGVAANRTMISSASTQITSASYISTNAPTGIFEVSNGTSGLFNVLSSGNVGIGTTAPGATLDVNGYARATSLKSTGRIFSTGSTTYDDLSTTTGAIIMNYDTTTATGFINARNYATTTDLPIKIGTNLYEKATGEVGIGTTSPSSLLSVGSTSQFQVNTTGDISTTGFTTITGHGTVLGGAGDTDVSLNLQNALNGSSSLIFSSGSNKTSDKGYIRYFDSTTDGITATGSGENNALVIGVENDNATDRIILAGGWVELRNRTVSSPGTSGYITKYFNNATQVGYITTAGALNLSGGVTAVGINGGTGLIQGTGGLTVTGAAVNLNASSNFPVNIATGTSTGAITIGGGTAGQTVAINSADWDIDALGSMTGISGIANNGAYTQTGASANTFTGATTFSGALTANSTTAFNGGTTGSTAPFTVDSTYVVANLNADLLDGQHGSYYATASSISGTLNYVSKFTGTGTTIGNSQIFDNGTGVGINDASPSYKLDVKEVDSVVSGEHGVALFSNVSQSAGVLSGYYADGATLTGGYSRSIGSLPYFLGTGSVPQAITILNAGSVGIGTISPTGNLNVVGTTGGFFFDGNGATYNRFKSTTVTAGIGRDLLFSAQDSGTTPDLYIKNNGYVGIGTTAPGAKLDVSGVGQSIRISDTNASLNTGDTIGKLEFYKTDVSTGGAGAPVYLKARTTDLGGLFAMDIVTGSITSPSTTLTLGETGNVGIGTTGPGSLLHLYGPTSATTEYIKFTSADGGDIRYGKASGFNNDAILGTWTNNNLQIFSNGNERMRINNTGNVGIGSTAPEGKLHISGATASAFPATTGTTPTGLITRFQNADSNGILDVGMNGGSGAWLQTTNRSNLALNYSLLLNPNGGYVGIGTTAPSQKLEIVDDSNGAHPLSLYRTANSVGYGVVLDFALQNSASARKVYSSIVSGITTNTAGAEDGYLGLFTTKAGTSTEQLRITSAGNVGIGTTAPLGDVGDLTLGSNAGGTADGKLYLYGSTAGAYSTFKTTSGNLHIDAATGAYPIYLNYYNGTGGVIFGNGATGSSANVSATGVYTGTGLALGTGTITSGLINGQTISSAANFTGTLTTASTLTANGTLDANGVFTLGDNGDLGSIDTSDWDISTTGAMTGISGIANNGAYTQTGTNINTFSGFSKLNGGVAINSTSGSWIYYPNVASYAPTGTIAGAMIIHTNINRTSAEMFKMHITGYGYGVSSDIDFTVVGYAYSGANGSVDGLPGKISGYSIVDNGNDGLAKRIGIDASGNVAIAVGDSTSSFYYHRLSVDYWSTRNSVDASTGWSVDTNTVSGFGWLDINSLIPTMTQTLTSVGIGTTAPGYSLDVQAASAQMQIKSTTGTNYALLKVNNTGGDLYFGRERSTTGGLATGSTPYAGIINAQGTYPLQLAVNNAIGITMLNGGNVGIGLTNPVAKLQVGATLNGSALGTTFITNAGSLGGTAGNTLTLANIGFLSGNASSLGVRAYRTATGTDWTTSAITIGMDVDSTVNAGGYLTFKSGNIGIGTTSPTNIFSVQIPNTTLNAVHPIITSQTTGYTNFGGMYNTIDTSPTIGVGILFRTYKQSVGLYDAMKITHDGNVGIGTTSPGNKLTVTLPSIASVPALGANGGHLGLWDASGFGLLGGLLTNGNAYLQVQRTDATATAYNLLLNPNGGNVGVGTTNPVKPLTIGSNVGQVGLRIQTGSGTGRAMEYFDTDTSRYNFITGVNYNVSNAFEITPSTVSGGTTYSTPALIVLPGGNVGVGTTGPSEKLSVSGSGLFTGNMSSKGIASTSIASLGFNSASYLYGITNSPTWTVSAGTYTNNNAVAPDGTTTASTLGLTVYSTNWDLYQTFSVTSGVSYKVGVWIKLGTATNFCMTVNNGTSWNTVGSKCFNSSDGLSTTGWTYVTYIFTAPASNLVNLHIGAAPEIGNTQTAGSVYAWNWEVVKQNGGTSPVSTFAGNVGIGTISPIRQTQISGVSQTTSAITDAGATGGTLLLSATNNASGAGGTLLFSALNDSSTYVPQAAIKSLLTNGATNGVGDLAFSTRNAVADTALTERMRILSGGNVGIGTTSPGSILDVGNMAGTSNVENIFRLTGRKTTFDGNFADIRLSNSTDSGGSYFGIVARRDVSSNYAVSADFTVNNNSAGATPLTAMTLQYNGNVGIGTTTPGVRFVNSGATLASSPTLGSGVIGANAILSANGLHGLYTGVSANGDVWQQVQRNDTDTSVYNLLLNPSGGNVGIGTTNPAQGKLWVQSGEIWMTGNSSRFAFNTDGSTDSTPNASILATQNGISGASADLIFRTWNGVSDAEIMRMRSNGNVGIGTVTPGGALDVRTSTSTQGIIGITTHTTGTNYGLDGEATGAGGTANYGGWFAATGAISNYAIGIPANYPGAGANNFAIYSASQAQSYFAGSVGIGVTNPSTALSVNGSVNYNDRTMTHLADSNAGTGRWARFASFTISNAYEDDRFELALSSRYYGGRLFLNLYSNSLPSDNYLREFIYDGDYGSSPQVAIYHTSTYVWDLYIYEDSWTSTSYSQIFTNSAAGSSVGSVSYYSNTYADPPVGYTSPSYNYFGSNIGLGTSTPSAKLDVYNSDAITTSNYEKIVSKLTEYDNDGSAMAVGQAVGMALHLKASGTGEDFDAGAIFGKQMSATSTKGGLTFQTNDGSGLAEKMRIDNAGNVGIGTTAPGAVLHIGTATSGNQKLLQIGEPGFAETYGLILRGDSTDGVFKWYGLNNSVETTNPILSMNRSNGNVGIGNTAPAALLSVGSTSQFQVSTAGRVTAPQTFVTGLSTSWGVTSGVNTGGVNVTMGTASSATWLISGTSGGVFRGGIQLYDPDGTTRIYAGAGFVSISTAGAFTSVGLNSGTGLIQGTGGLTVTGVTNINTSGALATNIGTGTSTGTITIGRSTGTDLALNDANWSVSGLGTAAFNSVNTGHGANQLYAMDQDVLTTSTPTFGGLTIGGSGHFYTSGVDIYANVLRSRTSELSIQYAQTTDYDVVFYGGGTTPQVSFKTDGKVGIGTTGPNASLEIKTADTTGFKRALKIGLSNFTSAGDGAYIDFGISPTDLYGARVGGVRTSSSTSSALVFYTGTTTTPSEQMRIDSNGYVGIGTTAPGAKLDVTGSGYSNRFKSGDTNWNAIGFNTTLGAAQQIYSDYTGTGVEQPLVLGTWTNKANQLYLATSGSVGIGMTNPTSKLDVYSSTADVPVLTVTNDVGSSGDQVGIDVKFASNSYGMYGVRSDLSALTGGAYSYAIYTAAASGTSDYAIYSASGKNYFAGNVGIGTTSPTTFKLQVDGSVGPNASNSYNLGASGLNWGCLYYNGGTLGTCASDQRLKQNISDVDFGTTDPLVQIAGLRPRSFSYISDTTNSMYNGLIAQEVEKVAPSLVVTGSNGYKAVKYGDLQWLTLEAVQELNLNLNAISGTIVPTAGSKEESFMKAFFANLYVKIGDWLGSADNGIKSIFARKISTKLLCVSDDANAETCIVKSQLDSLLTGSAAGSVGIAFPPAGTTVTVNPEAPVITLVGSATINLNVGATYTEEGANATDNKDTFVNVAITGVVDTATAGTYVVNYNAVDTDGNNAIQVIRTVTVSAVAPATGSTTPVDTTTTSTTTTDTSATASAPSASTPTATTTDTSATASAPSASTPTATTTDTSATASAPSASTPTATTTDTSATASAPSASTPTATTTTPTTTTSTTTTAPATTVTP